jgi:hypothetical protein
MAFIVLLSTRFEINFILPFESVLEFFVNHIRRPKRGYLFSSLKVV